MAALVKAFYWSPKAAIILAEGPSYLVTILGTRLWLLAFEECKNGKETLWRYLTIAFIVFMVVLRFFYSWTF